MFEWTYCDDISIFETIISQYFIISRILYKFEDSTVTETNDITIEMAVAS